MARRLGAPSSAQKKADQAAKKATEEAEREKKAADARLARANVTDDTCVAAVLECGPLKDALESAQGAYRAALKKWQERGVDEVAWFLKTRKRDVQDVEAEIRRRNRILRAMSFPLGAQLGMFDDGESVATKIENDKAAAGGNGAPTITTQAMLDEAHAAGTDAGRRGYGADVNPHQRDDGSPRQLAWEAARVAAMVELAELSFSATGSDAPVTA
jgi:hypothetical protein